MVIPDGDAGCIDPVVIEQFIPEVTDDLKYPESKNLKVGGSVSGSIAEAAEEVVNAWNDFVEEYFAHGEGVPDGTLIDDYVIDANSVIDLMKAFLQLVPAFAKYSTTLEDFNMLLHGNKQKAKEVGAQVRDDFSATMNKFFDKMGW